MTSLHVFGDSFSAQYTPPSGKWQGDSNSKELFERWFNFYKGYSWSEIIAKKLKAEFKNYSQAGAGMDFMLHQFLANLQNIKKGDYVFVVLTHYDRRWAVQRLPYASNLGSLKFDTFKRSLLNGQDKKYHGELYAQMEAAYNYWLYCRSEELEIITYMSYMQMFRHTCDTLGYNLFFIPALVPVQPILKNEERDPITENFNPFKIDGSLHVVSISEFIGETWDSKMELRNYNFNPNYNPGWCGVDPRIGHMSIVNHEIFADKLYNSIINNIDLNLNVGFEEQIIGKNDKTDTQLMWEKEFKATQLEMYKHK